MNYVGGITEMTANSRQPEMSRAMQEIDEAVNRIANQLDDLAGRLAPVLSPEGPPTALAGMPCQTAGSPMAGHLLDIARRANNAADHLIQLKGRLEI